TLRTQAWCWYFLFLGFALSIAACTPPLFALNARFGDYAAASGGDPDDANPEPAVRLLWLGLAACASLMFLAITNQLCQDVAPVPFLWILPLAIYLVSFIVCFGNEHWYRRAVFNLALAVAIVLTCVVLSRPVTPIGVQVIVYSLLAGCACMVCH